MAPETTAIDEAVGIAGSQSALARGVNVSPQAVQQWVANGRVSRDKVLEVASFTGISLTRLRPDVYPDNFQQTTKTPEPV